MKRQRRRSSRRKRRIVEKKLMKRFWGRRRKSWRKRRRREPVKRALELRKPLIGGGDVAKQLRTDRVSSELVVPRKSVEMGEGTSEER